MQTNQFLDFYLQISGSHGDLFRFHQGFQEKNHPVKYRNKQLESPWFICLMKIKKLSLRWHENIIKSQPYWQKKKFFKKKNVSLENASGGRHLIKREKKVFKLGLYCIRLLSYHKWDIKVIFLLCHLSHRGPKVILLWHIPLSYMWGIIVSPLFMSLSFFMLSFPVKAVAEGPHCR